MNKAWILVAGAGLAAASWGAPADSSRVVVARPGKAVPLTLSQCVARALAGNDAVRVERLRRRELDGQMRQALSTALPTVDASGVWNRGRDPTFTLDSTFRSGGEENGSSQRPATALDSLLAGFDFLPKPQDVSAQTFWRTSLNVHWTINPVRVMAAVGATREAIRNQDLVIRAAVEQAQEQVIAAFAGVVLAAGQIDAVQARLADQREFLDIMRMRQSLALATALDTLQAAVTVANLAPRMRLAERRLRTAGARLNVLMGAPAQAPLTLRDEGRVERDRVIREAALALIPRRAEVRELDAMVALLEENRRSQIADMWPTVAVNGSYGRVSRRLGGLDDTGHQFWSTSVALQVPVFDGMLSRGHVQQTEAMIRRTRAQRSALVHQIQVTVLDLLQGLDVARQDLKAAELNMKRADEMLETSKTMLRHGQARYLNVLEAAAERAQARTQLAQARYDVITTTAALKRALGVDPMKPLAEVPGLTAGTE